MCMDHRRVPTEPVMFQLDMDRHLGIFDFYGADYVFLEARFLVELHTYGRGDPIATFEIPNHDVLERLAPSALPRAS